MLDKYIGNRMVSRIYHINIKNCDTNQLLIFGRYHKVWESLYTWIHNLGQNPYWTILFIRANSICTKVLGWYIDPKWYISRSGINKGGTHPIMVLLRARRFTKSYTFKLHNIIQTHSMFCGIDNIPWYIPHIQIKYEKYSVEYNQSHKTLLWI
jgi:hypothetical protein